MPGLFEVQETETSATLEAFPSVTRHPLSFSHISCCVIQNILQRSHRPVHRESITFFTLKLWYNAHTAHPALTLTHEQDTVDNI